MEGDKKIQKEIGGTRPVEDLGGTGQKNLGEKEKGRKAGDVAGSQKREKGCGKSRRYVI